MSGSPLRRQRPQLAGGGRITFAQAAGEHPFAAGYERELRRLVASFSPRDRRTLLAIIELVAEVEAQHGASLAEDLVDRMLASLEDA
jgi:hypothetical protein